jgi:hypothetical protein
VFPFAVIDEARAGSAEKIFVAVEKTSYAAFRPLLFLLRVRSNNPSRCEDLAGGSRGILRGHGPHAQLGEAAELNCAAPRPSAGVAPLLLG